MRDTAAAEGRIAVGVLKTIAIAFSMFSRIPMPRVDWNEKNMKNMLAAFPLVGAIIGALLLLWGFISDTLGFGKILFAAGMTVIPIAVTGGIHLDGFCDTADALASHAPPERKREILKDPHSGAFAVISLCAYAILYFAFASELGTGVRAILPVAIMHVLSRSLSGLSVIFFPTSASKGLLAAFRDAAEKKTSAVILFVFLVASAAGMIISTPIGIAMAAAAVLCMLWLRIMSLRQFGGMSGDLAGWFLQTAELCMLAVLVIFEKAVA